MAFTPDEQARIRRFLSYPSWVSLASSIQLGYPAASQPLFLVDDAFRRLTPEAENLVRGDLAECECCEKQLSEARTRLKARRLGELELNPNEHRQVRRELLWWTTRLADDLGVIANPFSQMVYAAIDKIGGISGTVRG